jgi:hypothetical protein
MTLGIIWLESTWLWLSFNGNGQRLELLVCIDHILGTRVPILAVYHLIEHFGVLCSVFRLPRPASSFLLLHEKSSLQGGYAQVHASLNALAGGLPANDATDPQTTKAFF